MVCLSFVKTASMSPFVWFSFLVTEVGCNAECGDEEAFVDSLNSFEAERLLEAVKNAGVVAALIE